MDDIFLWIVSGVLILLGLAGTLLPALPGSLLILGGLWLAAWIEHFQYIAGGTLTILVVLTVLTYIVDFAASALGAKRFQASKYGILGSTLGAVLGIFLGLPGILLGPFAGAVAGELLFQRGLREATWSGVGAIIGLVIGTAAKLALVISMLGVFAFMRLMNN